LGGKKNEGEIEEIVLFFLSAISHA